MTQGRNCIYGQQMTQYRVNNPFQAPSLDPLWISRRLGATQRGLCLSRDGHGPSPAWESTPRLTCSHPVIGLEETPKISFPGLYFLSRGL